MDFCLLRVPSWKTDAHIGQELNAKRDLSNREQERAENATTPQIPSH